MAMAGLGAKINGEAVRPDTMNQWLESNKGYTCIAGDCNNLVLAAPGSLPGSPLSFVSEKPKPELREMREAVTAGATVFIGERMASRPAWRPRHTLPSPRRPLAPNSRPDLLPPQPLKPQLTSTIAATLCWSPGSTAMPRTASS